MHAAYLHVTPGGDLGLEDAAHTRQLSDVKINLGDGFSLDNASAPYLRLDLTASDWNLELSGFRYKDRSDSRLSAQFGDMPSGTEVNSSFGAVNAKGALTYSLLDLGVVNLAAGVCLDYFDIDMDVRAKNPLPAPATSYENTDYRAPVPMLFARAAVDVGPVGAEVSLGWMNAGLQDAKGVFLDLDGMISFRPIPNVDVFGGYRYIKIDARGIVDAQKFDTDLHLHGWYVGVGLNF